ncbi:MAG: ATP synthase F1 subunit epsilon [Patescibacteria group bacterium]
MADAFIHFELVTPERRVIREDIRQITLPTVQGEITVLPHHIPLVAMLRPGMVSAILADGSSQYLAVSGGFIEVLPHKVVILADTAEHSNEIDEQRAAAAHIRAKEVMAGQRVDWSQYTALAGRIEKELARIKVAQKKKYRNLPPPQPPK